MTDEVLSVVTRLHTTAGPALDLLSRALLSLAGATWRKIEPVIVTQQFSEEQIGMVERLADRFVWEWGCRPAILNYRNPLPGDHRTALLNLGIETARGRYLAFLDYDDYVYEHAYETLIGQLRRSESAIAFGMCLATYAVPTEHGYRITHKDRAWAGKTVDDFLTENMFPPNSFVIDRSRLPEGVPLIDERRED
ncbi:MAG: glycosyltransferase, partial [Chthoniobacter sp.]